MKVKMLESIGSRIRGEIYDTPGDLTENHARVYVRHGFAEIIEGAIEAESPKKKRGR